MEHPAPVLFDDLDPGRPWSPAGRPTLNTSVAGMSSPPSAVELSPHQAHWPQSLPHASPLHSLAAGPFFHHHQPHRANPDEPLPPPAPQPQMQGGGGGGEWGNIFSAPLEPAMFQALAASGVLGPAGGTPSSLPAGPGPVRHRGAHMPTFLPAHNAAWPNPPPGSYPTYPPPNMAGMNPPNGGPYRARKGSVGVPPYPASGRPGESRHVSRRSDGGIANDPMAVGGSFSESAPIGFAAHARRSSGDDGFHPGSVPGSFDRYRGHDRPPPGVPTTLWMSPVSSASPSLAASPVTGPYGSVNSLMMNHAENGAASSHVAFHGTHGDSNYTESTSSSYPATPVDPKQSPLFPDVSADVLLSGTSLVGSPELEISDADLEGIDAEQLAKDDPATAHALKMYRAGMTPQIDNLTWKMKALALKRKKDDETKMMAYITENGGAPEGERPPAAPSEDPAPAQVQVKQEPESADSSRGRTMSKGKGKVSIVGFDGKNQDGDEDTWVSPYASACGGMF
jgi:GATA-binding protein, other eukaryote